MNKGEGRWRREKKRHVGSFWDLSGLRKIGDTNWHMLKQLPLLNFHDLLACKAGHRYQVLNVHNGGVEDGTFSGLIVSSYLFYS